MPGSMPPDSTRIEEEGILIDNFKLVEEGYFREEPFVALLKSGPYPSRNIVQNIADIKAQIAANEKGVQELTRMVDHFRLDVVHAYMRHVQDNAEECVRRVIDVLSDGPICLHARRWQRHRRSYIDQSQSAHGNDRFHEYQHAAEDELQCTVGSVPCSGHVCFPHAGE